MANAILLISEMLLRLTMVVQEVIRLQQRLSLEGKEMSIDEVNEYKERVDKHIEETRTLLKAISGGG